MILMGKDELQQLKEGLFQQVASGNDIVVESIISRIIILSDSKIRVLPEITLGEKYTDSLHNLTGVASRYIKCLNGSDEIELEYMRGGELKRIWVDLHRLKPA